MMRDLFLHIGLPKTGTSFLQRILVENADRFLEAGLGVSALQARTDGDSWPLRKAIREAGLDAAMEQLATTPGDRVVASSEQLADWLEHRAFAEALRTAASRHFRPRVVICLRRQDFLKESLYSQMVKYWYEGAITDETHFEYDHQRRLAILESVFGRENVQVLLYREPGPNDILGDFLGALGVPERPQGLSDVGAQNVSMHRRKVLFLSQVPKPDPDIQNLSMLMTRVVGRTGAIADDGERFIMSPAQRRDLVARYLDGNRAIIAHYGLQDTRGFGELPDPDEAWTPPRPITPAEFAAVQAQAVAACFRSHRPRYAMKLAAKVAGAMPVMAWSRFVTPRPSSPAVPPTLSQVPLSVLSASPESIPGR